MTTNTTRAYRLIGTTDEVTTCGLCGREDLKGTVMLAPLDPDGNDEGVDYLGSDCAARAAGWTQRDVRTKIAGVRHAEQAAALAAREEEGRRARARDDAEAAEFFAWLAADRGVVVDNADNVWKVARAERTTFYQLRKQWKATLG